MQWTRALSIPILIGVLTLGVLVGAFVSGAVVMGQDSSATAQQNLRLLDDLVAKDAIREQIYNYSRGLDRMDKELARQVWHPDGTTNFVGIFEGTGPGFIDWVWEVHEAYVTHSHQMTNHPHRGRRGHSGQRNVHDGQPSALNQRRNSANTSVVRGRYADRWSKRDGRWAIDHRLYTLDFTTEIASGGPNQSVPSRRDRTDPSYQVYPH